MATNTIRLHRVLHAKPERVYRAFLDADAIVKRARALAANVKVCMCVVVAECIVSCAACCACTRSFRVHAVPRRAAGPVAEQADHPGLQFSAAALQSAAVCVCVCV